MGWVNTFALLAGLTLVSGQHDWGKCCMTAAKSNEHFTSGWNTNYYAPCACQLQGPDPGNGEEPEPPVSQQFDGVDQGTCSGDDREWCQYPQESCPYGEYLAGSDCCPNPMVESSGDPHMKNLLGEKFDLSKEGKHLLIQLPRGSGEELEVYGNIMEVKRERKCSLFFMTQLSLHGSAVGDQPVVIDVLNDGGISNFKVTVNKEKIDLNPDGTKVGKTQVKACSEKEALCKLINPTRRQPSEPQKVIMSLQNGVHLVTSYYQAANPFLNIAVAGLHNMDKVGGLLGHDDHTGVSAAPECSVKQGMTHNRKTSMFQLSNSVSDMARLAVGHIGSMSKAPCED